MVFNADVLNVDVMIKLLIILELRKKEVLKKLEERVDENKEDATILLPIIVDAVKDDKYKFVTFIVDAKMVDGFI